MLATVIAAFLGLLVYAILRGLQSGQDEAAQKRDDELMNGGS